MNFLYPGFLFALIAVAIPIIIHLFNFRKFKKVYFSNVHLLKDVEQQNSSREKIKNLLILLVRILAIIFLVLAFAQPYISERNQRNNNLNNVISVYIDNSYSMEAVNQDGNLLDEAKRRAKDLVKGFGFNDRFQILTNDFEGKHQRLLDQDEFLKALDDIKISPSNRTLQQIVNRQANVLAGSSNQYSFIISDFQKNISALKPLNTNSNIQYALIKLNATPLANIAIDSVWTLSPNHQPGANEKLVVQLKNYSDQDAKNVPLKLYINNNQKGLGAVSIPAGKIKRDTLNFSGLHAGWQKGVLTIKDYPVTFDDTLSFTFKVDQNLRILSINGNNSGSYIKSLFGVDSYYQLTENAESKVNYNQFNQYSLIILNGLGSPSSGLAQQLKTYLNGGGSVVIFPDLDADLQIYNAFLSNLSLPNIQSLNNEPSKVEKIDLENPIFKTVFEEVPKNLDLPTVNRYFSFTENNQSNKENIMQLPGAKLFFAKYGIGNGQVYLSASGLNIKDGNLARHPVFVPLMYRLTLNGGQEQALYSSLDNNQVVSSKQITLGKNQSLKLVSKNFEVIPEVRQIAGKTLIYTADQIKTPGFYNLKMADSLLAVYSFNSGRSESDMHYFSRNEIDNLASKGNFKVFDADQDAVKLIASGTKIKQTLWKLCLILSLIFLAIEILLLKFYNNPKKTI